MRTTIAILLLAYSSIAAAGGTSTPSPENLSLQVSMNFKQHEKNGSFNEYLMKNSFKAATNDHQWLTIQNNTESTSDQFILLGRIENADAQQLTMKFLVLDTGEQPGVISAPTMVVRYGQPGQINIAAKSHKIQLTLTAATN